MCLIINKHIFNLYSNPVTAWPKISASKYAVISQIYSFRTWKRCTDPRYSMTEFSHLVILITYLGICYEQQILQSSLACKGGLKSHPQTVSLQALHKMLHRSHPSAHGRPTAQWRHTFGTTISHFLVILHKKHPYPKGKVTGDGQVHTSMSLGCVRAGLEGRLHFISKWADNTADNRETKQHSPHHIT